MSMTGAIVNALAIVAGGAVGLLFQRGIPERVSKTVMIGLGLCVLYIGISGAFACQSILIVIVAMTLGAAAGAAVFVVAGALTLLAGAIAPLLSEAAVADLTCAGSLLVAAIGLNQTGATKIKVADYLPALLFVPLIRWLVSLPVWQQIAAWF